MVTLVGPTWEDVSIVASIRFDMSMSLDGYVTAADTTVEEPMGPGGQILMEHWSVDDAGRRAHEESQASVGASIAGRRTYDTSIRWWQADGPCGERRTPTFIVSHTTPDDVPADSVYVFVSSPQDALEAARAVAGDKDVDIFSPSIGQQQQLAAGQVDELWIHLMPVPLGAGTRLVDDLGGRHIRPRRLHSTEGDMASHIRDAVIKD